MDANNTPTVFTDDDLDSVKKSMAKTSPFYFSAPYEWVQGLLGRLEAAEKALKNADGAIYSVYDPYKNDCPMCDNFLGPCKDYCDFPKFHQSLETWRKVAGK